MKSYNQLKEDFEKRVERLQSKCKHKKTSWLIEWWAIAHPTGKQVLICDFCNKKLESRIDEVIEE